MRVLFAWRHLETQGDNPEGVDRPAISRPNELKNACFGDAGATSCDCGLRLCPHTCVPPGLREGEER